MKVTPPLTEKQFDALIALARLQKEVTKKAVYHILVEGTSVTQAAQLAGCSITSASNAHIRCITTLNLVNALIADHLQSTTPP